MKVSDLISDGEKGDRTREHIAPKNNPQPTQNFSDPEIFEQRLRMAEMLVNDIERRRQEAVRLQNQMQRADYQNMQAQRSTTTNTSGNSAMDQLYARANNW